MATCVRLRRKKTYVCIGSMNQLIDIYVRNIKPPMISSTSGEYFEEFTFIHRVWAFFETPKGLVIFDDVNPESGHLITNIFHIRYLSDITSQNWIKYDNKWYKIIRVTDLEENRLFTKIECIFSGKVIKKASEA